MTLAVPREKGYQHASGSWWAMDPHETSIELQWPSCIGVYDQMRRTDPQIKSILSAATLPIRRTRWFIDPAGADAEVVRLVSDSLGLPIKGDSDNAPRMRGGERFSWDDHLRLAMLELTFGHSFFEQVYRVGDDGRARLRRLGWRPPRTISEISVGSDGGLESISQIGGVDGRQATIPVSQLVAYVNEREGGNWLGQSVLRPAFKFWLLKDRLLRISAQTIDRNGMGVPVYEAPDFSFLVGAGGYTAEQVLEEQDAELERGQTLASGFRSGENSGAAIPHGAKLTLQGVTGELPDALPMIRYYDEQIGTAVLANFLQLGGSDSTGSYALGATFADFFVQSLQAEALHIADVTNKHVVNDLVDLNFGTDAPAPVVAFDEIGTQQHATATGIAQLVASGALLPEPNLEAYIRDMFDIPEKSPYQPPATTVAIAQNSATNLARELRAMARNLDDPMWSTQ